MISIVLPTYNGEDYIIQSIESVLAQTYKDFELIVVNDCSNDYTPKIIAEYEKKDTRIKVINNKQNKKLPASLNIGFEVAKGDYFTWTSDDNLYKYNALEKMIEVIEKNPQIDLVYADYDLINENGKVTGIKKPLDGGEINKLYYANTIGACFLYKRKLHEVLGGYDVNKFLIEDMDFWLRAARYFKFMYIDKNLYQYRYHENSLTATRQKEIIKRTQKEFIEELKDKDCPEFAKPYICITLLNYEYLFGTQDKFNKYMYEIKSLSPHIYKNLELKYKLSHIFGKKIIRKIGNIVHNRHAELKLDEK